MLDLPTDFVQFIRNTYGIEAANAWFQRLPAILEECADRWQLTMLPPFPQLSFHYVAPAIRADGMPVVLKTCEFSDEFEHGLAALRLFAGRGIVRLLEYDEQQKVMLLERLQPGMMLATLVPERDEYATSVLASLMRQLWQPAPVAHSFPTVAHLGQGLLDLRAHYTDGYGPFPAYLVDAATDLFMSLNASASQTMLLHGDLQHYNVLNRDQTWCAIDPKGVVGDSGYDVGALIYNPMPRFPDLPQLERLLTRRVDQLSEELAMERARVRGWGLVKCVLNAWWIVAMNKASINPPPGLLRCAQILAHI